MIFPHKLFTIFSWVKIIIRLDRFFQIRYKAMGYCTFYFSLMAAKVTLNAS